MKTKLILTLVLLLSGIARAEVAGSVIPVATPELLKKGAQVYQANCLICHGEKGNGLGPAGINLSPHPRNFTLGKFKKGGEPEQIFKTISNGLPGTAMASFGHLTKEQRWALVYYVKAFDKGNVQQASFKASAPMQKKQME